MVRATWGLWWVDVCHLQGQDVQLVILGIPELVKGAVGRGRLLAIVLGANCDHEPLVLNKLVQVVHGHGAKIVASVGINHEHVEIVTLPWLMQLLPRSEFRV